MVIFSVFLYSISERNLSMVGSLHGLVLLVQETFIMLGCSGQPSTKYFFIKVHYFNICVPIAQQPGQAVVQGRLSAKCTC
jgi:hypothetical protein